MILPRFVLFVLAQRGPMTAPEISKMTGSHLLLVVLALKWLERKAEVVALPGTPTAEQVARAIAGEPIIVWRVYCPVSDV